MSEEGFFSKYISQPIKNFYNYVTGKSTEESNDVRVNSEGSADFAVDQDIPPSTGENDVI
ncbi:hypothetical protein [Candidatus Wolbachia massiliensis]|uniref:Uncharacterized protein n=1 Tax=Candidatus Wolbachia massiliensis TaxID=1845000 RepID=A0A7M3U395_9RICK|nr:hypothetical protein [Candidatus Wolbachia massiliensis]QOD38880.1 hypothetical protein ID128_04770 [Candidatus Wolbachia massiliensis]